MIRKFGPAAAALSLGWASMAAAQSPYAAVNDSGDTAWVLIAAIMVLLMALPGLALSYCGRVRARNVVATALQGAAVVAAVSALWIALGYTLAFGPVANGWIGGGSSWMLNNLGNVRVGLAIPESTFALFHLALAAFAAALMVGAWVERARLGWIVIFCTLWSVLIYAPVTHWIWGHGWMAARLGVLDFAGGLTIHATAGTSALVVALLLGRRRGFPQTAFSAYAPALSLAGGLLLWVGWLGLAGGAALAANDDASATIINTHVSACLAALTFLLIERIAAGKISMAGFAKGALAGLVAITPAAGFVSPGGAMLIGLASAVLCQGAIGLVKHKLHIDDSLDIFSIHGVGGVFGSIALAIFLAPELGGTGYAPGMGMASQLTAQAVASALVVLVSAVGSAIIALGISLFLPMRVSEAQENEGLDAAFWDAGRQD